MSNAYKVTFKDAIRMAFTRMKDYETRSNRAEYWWFVLFYFLMTLVLGVFGDDDGVGFVLALAVFVVLLAVFLAALPLAVRRLHDIGKSGWWILLGFIPLIGPLILIMWHARKGDAGPNQYGPDPLEPVVKVEILN